ncbi:acetoacetate-CoA ligase [Clavulina sp. PMI_390]|nr:acetoacetate-CoA ligase [Clavulina sp. PMI_390]
MQQFWNMVWDEAGLIGEKGFSKGEPLSPMESAPAWFPKAKINWAENMLKCRQDDKIAMIQATEPTPENPSPAHKTITYASLYTAVAHTVQALLELGISPGDRVASYSSNCIENVVATLAATAVGAIWVSAAADFGPFGVIERLEQVRPRVLFSIDSMVYNAKKHDHIPKLRQVISGLDKLGLAPEKVVIISLDSQNVEPTGWDASWISWKDFLARGAARIASEPGRAEIPFYRGSFDHPLWILFSSGTTGKPKPIVHRAGGMLIQLAKELVICGDFVPDDVFFYYTTTGWMMWNYLVSGLQIGMTLVLYDGSPLKDPSLLWKLTDELKITVFGTSAKYLEQLAKGYEPLKHHSLASLRMVLSTGSPLAPVQFEYVYSSISPNVTLGSITGGTDICSLFAGMNTSLPVYRGEIQCRMLGMSIKACSEDGKTLLPAGTQGELVCDQHFPCQPLGFWPLEGYGNAEDVTKARKRYYSSYYETVQGVWYHGDHVCITESKMQNGGGVIMLGRSDGVLNPGGIRFGSAEIYQVIDLCFSPTTAASPDLIVTDALVVGQPINNGTDERVILFLRLPEGASLHDALVKAVKSEIRTRRSPRHVPAKILQVKDVPHTLNGKPVEVPVKKLISGAPKSGINASTLRNPECLDEYEALGKSLREELV